MNKQFSKYLRRFIKYMRNTWKNKVAAITLFGLGYFIVFATGELVLMVLAVVFGIPLFLTNENCFYKN